MNTTAHSLLERIQSHDALIGIIGLGYVGLPLALAFTERGFQVFGFDVDQDKVEQLNGGGCYIQHLDCGRVQAAVDSGLLYATSDFSRLGEPDAILICVPTPLTPQREPDMTYVRRAAFQISEYMRPGQLIVLESTTWPGTTDELVLPILEGRIKHRQRDKELSTFNFQHLTCGADFFLAFSPEREDPGNKNFGTTNTPKVVGGVDQASGDLAQALYDQIMERTVRVASAREAEASKLVENIFRSVNIALVNELKMIFDRMGIDVWEVLDAAETKPFGFMRFNPGPGLGGHCVRGDQWLRVRGRGLSGVYRAEELYRRLRGDCDVAVTRSGMYVETPGLETLALNATTGEVSWFPVNTLYRGRFEGSGLSLRTTDNRSVVVTAEHPMLVRGKEGFDVVPAHAVREGDELPIVSDLGEMDDDPVIDLIDIIPIDERHRVWVRVRNAPWSNHERALKGRFGWTIRDSIRKNSLRLDRYLEVELELGVHRSEIVLMTGKGRARREFPSSLVITPNVARLIGYYLAEGCITRDSGAIRIRWTFNRSEVEYIDDVRSILKNIGFEPSVFNDRKWHSTTIKLSSLLFGWLLDNRWECGTRSEEMRVPDQLFGLSWQHKREILRGLLRGDGDVWVRSGRRTYTKNDKTYNHNNTTAVVGFFSSSPVLLEQAVLLLQDLGFRPGFKQGSSQIRLHGAATIESLAWYFDGEKQRKLEASMKTRKRRPTSRSDRERIGPDLTSARVKTVSSIDLSGFVYSLEVERAEAFSTNSGIVVHNCIPIDPFYLSWKAREHGVPTKFIELAGEINHRAPEYVLEKLAGALNDRSKPVKGSKVLVLGLAYKKDIDDPRESPSFEIIDGLLRLGADVSYHDPHIPVAPKMRSWPDLPPLTSTGLDNGLEKYDAVVIVTDHSTIDYEHLLEHSRLIIDTRGVYRESHPNVVKA